MAHHTSQSRIKMRRAVSMRPPAFDAQDRDPIPAGR